MPTRISICYIVLVATIGLAACQGTPVQPTPAGSTESSPTSPGHSGPTQAPVVPSATPEPLRADQTGQTPTGPRLSTPALIDQALARGEITAGQRLLYLAYAVYEYESLPAQFRSNVGWRGTETVRELRMAADDPNVMCSLGADVQSELRRLLKGGATCN